MIFIHSWYSDIHSCSFLREDASMWTACPTESGLTYVNLWINQFFWNMHNNTQGECWKCIVLSFSFVWGLWFFCHSTGGGTDRDDNFWDLSFFHCLLSSFVSSRLWSPQQQKSVKDKTEWKRNYHYVQYFSSNWAGTVLVVLWHWIYAVLHFLVSEVLFGSLQVEVANISPDIWMVLRDDTLESRLHLYILVGVHSGACIRHKIRRASQCSIAAIYSKQTGH